MTQPDGWDTVVLNDLLTGTEYGTSAPTIAEGTRPVVGMRNLRDGHISLDGLGHVDEELQDWSTLELKAGDLLLNRTNSPDLVGRVGIVSEHTNAVFASYLVRLNADTAVVDPYFLNYFLNGSQAQRVIKSLATRGVSQANINPTVLRQHCPVQLPPLSEQRKIAEILQAWDEAIEHVRRLQHVLEARRNAISSELIFGGGQPHGTSWEFVADDWAIRPIGELASETGSRNSALRADTVLTCSKHRGFVRSDEYFGRTVHSADLSNYKLVGRNEFGFPSNHVEEGSIGLQNVVDTGAVSPIYTVFKFDDEVIDARFAYLVLKSPRYTYMFRASTSATVDRRGSLRWPDFSKLPFPVPPLGTQARIVRIVDDLNEDLAQNVKLETQYREQKRGLMQKLLTGEIRVTGDDTENLEAASND
ncbi:restriction endonuclease subunit S [Rhodoglobus aureus]|uniref:Type I restriction modification DNA specificity domain-containing protein n=1 Tax=Rhodoglobus aureus TaxID=191497 RepID=A0ABN1VJH0_9MICO